MSSVRQLPEIPETVSNAYVGLRYMLDCLRTHWPRLQKVFGTEYPNCHVVARAIARRFDMLEVRDGVVAGEKIHSWLVFRDYPEFIIDAAPIGAVPVLSSPILLFCDPFAFDYAEGVLPEERSREMSEKVQRFDDLLRIVVQSERERMK